MKKILGLLRSFYFLLISPNKVAQIVGVKYGKNPNFRTKYFGTEPFLIEVGDNFQCAMKVYFITHDGSVGVLRNLYPEHKNIDLFEKIIIGNNVFIGINVIILPGTRIGNNVIVGAGSVVRGTLDSNNVYAGVPVKYICSIEEYKNKNKNKFIDTKSMEPMIKKQFLKNHFNLNL